jgi:hypothetical protein
VHFVAWNFEFPIPIEKSLWRIASLVTTVLPCAVALLVQAVLKILECFVRSKRMERGVMPVIFIVFLDVLFAPYVVARLFIIVECFRALGFLDPDVFRNTWSSFSHAG